MSVFTFARATRAALVFSVLLLAVPGCAPDADLPAVTSGEGSAAPAPDTGAVSTPEDVKEDAPNSDAGADAADILSLDATDGTRTQGTLGITSFSYCNTALDCPNGMGTCVTQLPLNRIAAGGTAITVNIKTVPGFSAIPANKAGVCSRSCTDHPEVCTGLRVGADTTPWSCQLAYAGSSPYPASGLPFSPNTVELAAGPAYGSLCRPPFERAAAYTPDFCDSCSATNKCENSSACIDDAFYSDQAADQRTGHCLVACNTAAANACPTGFACRIQGTGEAQLGTPKEGTFCFPTIGSCTSCLDRDGDGVGLGGCTAAGGSSAVDCNDTDSEIYFDASEPDHAFPGSCGANLDANCNGISDDKEQIGVTDEDGNLIYGAEHCNGCFNACGGSEGVGEAASRRSCEVTSTGGAFGNISACRPSCDYPDLRADCSSSPTAGDGCETQIDGRASLSIRDCDSDGHGDALATASDLLFDCDGLGVTAVNPRDGSSCAAVRVLRTGPYGDDCDDTQNCVNPGKTEVCDGYDNDCDGEGDESMLGVGQACTVDSDNVTVLGACRNGFRLCGPGTEGLICGASLPTTESCDGLDNNCDGTTDNLAVGGRLYDAAGTLRIIGDSCTVPNALGVCAAGSWQCSAGGAACLGPTASADDLFNDPDLLDTNCDGIDGKVAEAIFVKTAGANRAGAAGSVASPTFGPTALGTTNNPVGSLRVAFELIAQRALLSTTKIRQIHIAASQEAYAMPTGLTLGADDANFAIVGGYEVVLSTTVSGGVTSTSAVWTAGSAGTQLTFDGATAFGDNLCGQNDTVCAKATDDIEAAITVTDPDNIVFRNVNVSVGQPEAGFGPIAGIKCTATATGSCAGLILDGFGIRLDGGADGSAGVDGQTIAESAAGSSLSAPVSGAAGSAGCRGQGSGGPGGVGASAPLSRRSGYSAPDFAYGSGGGGQLSQSETVMIGQSGFVPRDPAMAASGGVAAVASYPLSLFASGPGSTGRGGGGGGGGAGWKNRGGAGGAAGGCGGNGGSAGSPGGSVFGLVNLDPLALPTARGVSIEIATAGMGGLAGSGGMGQQGGPQNKSPISFTTPFLDAATWTANGGNNDWFAAGGAGGSGGGGGGGAGGPGGWAVGVAKYTDLALPDSIQVSVSTGGMGGVGGMGGMGGVIATGVGGSLPVSGNQGLTGVSGGALIACALGEATSGDVTCAAPALLDLGENCQLDRECTSGRCASGPAGSLNDRCAPAGMNYLPAGTYYMGSYAGEPNHQLDEVHHRVALTKPFFLDATEVTQAKWREVSGGTNPAFFQSAAPTQSSGNAAPNSPVENLDFYAALGFANARSAAEGLSACYALLGCEAAGSANASVAATAPFCTTGYTYTAPVAAVTAVAASCIQTEVPAALAPFCTTGFTYVAATTEGSAALCKKTATPAATAPFCTSGFVYTAPIAAVAAVAATCTRETGAWRDGTYTCTGYSQVADCTGYRLPTEAEWEYAARAGATDARYWGNNYNGDYQWEKSNTASSAYTRTVGTALPNAWGLYDMLGNVSELVADGYAKLYPSGAIDPLVSGTNLSLFRINRGGSINDTGVYVYGRPHAATVTTRSRYVGIRLARTVSFGGAGSAVAATACPAGFHLEGGSCTSDVRACVTTHGSGIQTYGTLGWSGATCVAQLCDNGFEVIGNSCKASYGTLCSSDIECAAGYCASAADGTDNDRCAPTGMVTIPRGSFVKKVSSTTPGTVTLAISRSFFMDEAETTQQAWKSLSGGTNPSCIQNPPNGTNPGWACTTTNNFDAGPVERVDWYAAMAYANARSASEGLQECYSLIGCPASSTDSIGWRDGAYACSGVEGLSAALSCTGYRLPTEMEWEYAARAGNAAEPSGANITYSNSYANPTDTSDWTATTSAGRTQAVKTKPATNSSTSAAVAGIPNKWGLYDMAGNVFEMVEDWEPTGPPYWPQTDQTDFRGNTVANNEPILRGGSTNTAWNAVDGNVYNWAGGSQNSHAFNNAYRGWGARSTKSYDVGFRLVRSVVQAPAGGDCGSGFHLDVASNTCEADSKACISSGTAGFSAWDGDSWGTCQKCQAGFVAEPAISSTTTALTGVASSTPTACVPVADQPRTGEGTLCYANGVVTNGTATPLAGDVSGRLDFTTTTGALTGAGTDSSFGLRDSSIPIATRSDKFSVTLTAGQTLFVKVSSTGLRGAADRFVPVLYLFGDDPAAAGSQCNRLATASGNASAIDVTGSDGGGGLATSESEAVIRFRAPGSGTYYLIVTSTEPVSASALPYNLVVNGAEVVSGAGKELGEACTADSQCTSRSCSLGDVSNNSGIGTIGPLAGTGVWPALPTALRVCTPTPDSAWPTGLPDTRTDMVLIPAGSFMMGSPGTEKWRKSTTSGVDGEESQHRVTISRPFFLQRLETTQAAFTRITGSTSGRMIGTTSTATSGSLYPLVYTDYYSAIGFANELSRREGLNECYTVTCQSTLMNSWIDGEYNPTECSAVALTSASCTGYRLPTESEWEYAARAGTTGAVYYDPNGDGQAENVALNSIANWAYSALGAPQPGGRFAPNPWGLYDIIGNAWEYVHDSYAAYPTASNSTDPGLASPASKAVILRGSDWGDANVWNRAAARYNWSANGSLGDARSNYSNNNVGFRLARTAITPVSFGTPCAPGYHVSGNICDVDQIACYLDNATAAKQTWNGTAFGSCIATACATGFHVEEGACLSDKRTCSNASGTGVQNWVSGTTYENCLQALGGLCSASSDCDGNAQNLAYCPAAPTGLPTRRCAPTGMIYLPPATYTAGSPNNEANSGSDENLFQATISRGLFIGTTEVTQAEWKAVSNNINPSCFQSTTGTGCTTSTPTSNNNAGPVERVDWYSAAAYANARSIAEGLTPCYARRQNATGEANDPDWRDGDSIQNTSLATIACDGYRLPTDAEWEYAARAGSSGPSYNVPNGSAAVSQANLNAIAWNTNNAGSRTNTVGQKLANTFGLYDVLGNVEEWGHDTHSNNPTTAQTDPIEHTTWGGSRSSRSSSYLNAVNSQALRFAEFNSPAADSNASTIGLRLVRTPVLTAMRGACPSGYHAVGTLCEPDLQACATTATNAVGTAKSWNAATSSFGACLPYNCATGFHLEGGACLSNSKTCTVGTQTGVQDWSSGTTYSSCKLPLGALCTANADCASTTLAPTYCATGPTGTANDRCAPAGMNFIPAGTFVMGSPAAETGRAADEVQHQVTLSRPFFMGAKEVTQAEWTTLAGDLNPSCNQNGSSTLSACGGSNANPTGPVERLDWYAAVGYANARSESEGLTPCYTYTVTRSESWLDGDHIFALATPPGSYLPTLNCTGYRLPTEAEWEYAARAGTTGAIYNAANPLTPTQAELNLIAWSSAISGNRTRAGGALAANNWGLFDMLGNVYEYQWDTYAAYPTTAVTDPLGAVSGNRGIKGNALNEGVRTDFRTARRYSFSEGLNPLGNVGFRLVRTAVLPVAQSACPTGYHVNTADKVCSPDTIACSSTTSTTLLTSTQTWNGTAYGACTP